MSHIFETKHTTYTLLSVSHLHTIMDLAVWLRDLGIPFNMLFLAPQTSECPKLVVRLLDSSEIGLFCPSPDTTALLIQSVLWLDQRESHVDNSTCLRFPIYGVSFFKLITKMSNCSGFSGYRLFNANAQKIQTKQEGWPNTRSFKSL